MHLYRGNYVIIRRQGKNGVVERVGKVTSSNSCSSKRHCKYFATAQQMGPCIACMGEYIRIRIVYIKEFYDPKWRLPIVNQRFIRYKKRGLLFANYNCTKITTGELALIKLEVGQ